MFACGIGYDVHRFLAGRLLVLGGVTNDHPLGLEGHSDADVLCHAIADALLGAAGESDIGHLFPNTEESVRGMSSIVIVRTVRERLSAKGSVVLNVDATLVAEAPKIALRWQWAAVLTVVMLGILVGSGVALWRTTRFS